MTTPLMQAMTAGVFVEFHDGQGHSVGQAIFTDWQGRPLPAVGDWLQCAAHCPASGRPRKLAGRVISRWFELQHEGESPCVWVRLDLQVGERSSGRPRRPASFSEN